MKLLKALQNLHLSLKNQEIYKDYKNDPSSLEYDLKKQKEQENKLSSYLKFNIEELERENKNKLNENIVFAPTIMFESDQKYLKELEDNVDKAKELVVNKEQEIK